MSKCMWEEWESEDLIEGTGIDTEGGQDMQDRQQVSHRTGCRTGHRTVMTCFRT